jgi:hypothetical protein
MKKAAVDGKVIIHDRGWYQSKKEDYYLKKAAYYKQQLPIYCTPDGVKEGLITQPE